MNYHYDVLDNGHIIVLTMHFEYDVLVDMIESSHKSIELLENAPDRVVFISDARAMSVKNVGVMLEAASLLKRPELQRFTQHPKLLKSLTVNNNRALQAVLRGLNHASFGHWEVSQFETLDEAIDAARKMLKAEKQTI